MPFKYEEYHKTLSCTCPDIGACSPVIRTSYRFCHENLNHPNNFLPPYIINNSRIGNDCRAACSGFALSFFTSLSSAEKKYIKIAEHAPAFIDAVGEFIAECDLRENDGVGDKPTSNGHFDFHEFQNTEFSGRFRLIKKVRP